MISIMSQNFFWNKEDDDMKLEETKNDKNMFE